MFLISNLDQLDPPFNGPIHVVIQIIKNVMTSAAEAKTGASFINGQEGCSLRTTLIDGNGPSATNQPLPFKWTTPVYTCAEGIINATVKQCHSKAIDMRFYWLHDGIAQGQFSIHWKSGATNLANDFTKHHAPAHHQLVRPIYLHESSHCLHHPNESHGAPTTYTLYGEGVSNYHVIPNPTEPSYAPASCKPPYTCPSYMENQYAGPTTNRI